MTWNIDKNRPICPQICQQLCAQIACGRLLPGQRVLSVRDVAMSAGVNPNTVQRAFGQLEQQGVLYSERGSGWFVGTDIQAAVQLRQQLAREKTDVFIREMTQLGLSSEDIKIMVKEWEV